MSQHNHQECYGNLFPTTLCAKMDKLMSGKAFSFELRRAGGMFISDRVVAVNMEEWDECQACSEFENCYKLSLAKLALMTAISG